MRLFQVRNEVARGLRRLSLQVTALLDEITDEMKRNTCCFDTNCRCVVWFIVKVEMLIKTKEWTSVIGNMC